jgi:hypothetical protein
VERLLPEDASPGVRNYSLESVADALWRAYPPAEPLGDAIGTAVSDTITDALAHYADILPHGESDPCPYCDPTCRLDHRSLSSGTADDWHGMDRPQGRSGR